LLSSGVSLEFALWVCFTVILGLLSHFIQRWYQARSD
jgi:hypothetical protein